MIQHKTSRTWFCCLAAASLVVLAGMVGVARGQSDLIGGRGGQTAPSSTLPAGQPVLPSNLNLPPAATSSLLSGLNTSGTALRPGMGWLVSDLTHEGIHGRQLADIIHQLKPYKQQGVLTFPQTAGQPGTTTPAPGSQRQPFGFQRGDDDERGHERGQGQQGFGRGGKGGKGGKR